MKINEEKNYKKFSSLLNGGVFKIEIDYYLKINTTFINTSGTSCKRFNCVNLNTGELEYCPEDKGVTVYPDAELTL